MLADQLDYVIGVDPHRDTHALAIVEARTGVVVFEAMVAANSGGYAEALQLAERHAAGRRAFAVEGTGSFGAGLTRFLTAEGQQVFEVSRLRRAPLWRQDRCSRCCSRRPQRPRRETSRDPACQRRTRGAAGSARGPGGSGQREDRRAQPAPRPAHHHPRASPQRATPAQPGSPAGASDLRSTRPPERPRAPRHPTRPQSGRATHPAADGRGTRARARDRTAHLETRSPVARPARYRTAARRPAPALLVTPRAPQKRSGLRPPRRGRPDPRLLWPNHPPPPRPQRRPETQPHPPPDHRHSPPLAPAHDRLHPPQNPRRQEPPRSNPLPQALPRPQPLPAPREPATNDLTNIEASLAQPTRLTPEPRLSIRSSGLARPLRDLRSTAPAGGHSNLRGRLCALSRGAWH
jgi:hypothetical protein